MLHWEIQKQSIHPEKLFLLIFLNILRKKVLLVFISSWHEFLKSATLINIDSISSEAKISPNCKTYYQNISLLCVKQYLRFYKHEELCRIVTNFLGEIFVIYTLNIPQFSYWGWTSMWPFCTNVSLYFNRFHQELSIWHAKVFEKLIFLTPCYAHISLSIMG